MSQSAAVEGQDTCLGDIRLSCTIGIALSGDGGGLPSIGGSDGDSRKHIANVFGAQWSARAKTARAFFTGLELVHVQLDELWVNVKQAKQAVCVWVIYARVQRLSSAIAYILLKSRQISTYFHS
jgi:hypothetical protein